MQHTHFVIPSYSTAPAAGSHVVKNNLDGASHFSSCCAGDRTILFPPWYWLHGIALIITVMICGTHRLRCRCGGHWAACVRPWTAVPGTASAGQILQPAWNALPEFEGFRADNCKLTDR